MPTSVEEFAIIVNDPSKFDDLVFSSKNALFVTHLITARDCLKNLQFCSGQKGIIERNENYFKLQLVLERLSEMQFRDS